MSTLRKFLPTGLWIRLAIVPVLVLVAMSVNRSMLRDFWHHLARGQYMVTEGQLLNTDIFTYTVTGTYFLDVNWLSQILYYWTFQLGGLELVQVANALLLALAFFLLVLMCWQKSQSLMLATAVGIVAFFGSWNVLAIRPQTFSLLFFVVIYWSLDRFEKRPWLLLIPPILTGLWANMHGAFPISMVLIGCFGLIHACRAWTAGNLWKSRECWHLAGCLLASFLATLINPYGWTIYEYVGRTSGRATDRAIREWLPPQFGDLIFTMFALSVIAFVGLHVAAWIKFKRPPTIQAACLMLCFLPPAFMAVRMVVWWLLVAAPVCAELLVALIPKAKDEAEPEPPSVGSGLVFAVMVVLAVLNLPILDAINPLARLTGRSSHRPEHDLELAFQHIRERSESGHIFTRFEWGEYTTWSAGPQFKVFMDARIEIIPDDVWQQYTEVSSGYKNWQAILDQYKVDYLVLDPEFHSRHGLLEQVQQSDRWQQTFRVDDEVYVYERTNGVKVAETQ